MSASFTYLDMECRLLFRRVFFSSLVLLLPLLVLGQVKPSPAASDTAKAKFIIIDHFGKLIEDKEGIETVKWISQGLQLRIDSTYIYADSAVIFG